MKKSCYSREGYSRVDRLSELLQRKLSVIIQQHSHNKSFRLLTITRIITAKDLSHAKVFITYYNDDQAVIKDLIKQLNKAAGFFRTELAQLKLLRTVPRLKFFFDDSTLQELKVRDLLDRI